VAEKELESLLQALDHTLLQHRQLIETLSKTEVPELVRDWYQILRLVISNKKYVHHFHELPKSIDIVSREDFIVEFCRRRRVLHVGCVDEGLLEAKLQSGNLLHQKLQRVSQHLVGIDISVSGIELLRKAGFQDVFLLDVNDVDKLPYKDFDVILLGEVLEHLPNPGQALEALAAFSDADFLITVPNMFSWESMLFARRDIEFVNPDHCYYFSYHTLRMLLQKCNYRILDMRYYTHRISNPGFVAKLKERPQFCEGLICIARVGRTAEGESLQPLAQNQQKMISLLDQQINTEEETLLSIQKELSTLKAELIQLRQKMLGENQALKEQLRIKEKEKDLAKAVAQLEVKAREIDELGRQLQDKHQELQRYLQTKEQELQQAATQLQTKEKDLTQMYEESAKLKKTLAEVYNSFGWKLLEKFWQLANRLLPPGSRRRLWFNRALFAVKVVMNEGWMSLGRRVKRKWESKQNRVKLMVVVPVMEAGGAERRTSTLLKQLDRKLIEPELAVIFDREIAYSIPGDVHLHILEKLSQPAAQIDENIKLPDHLQEQQGAAVFLETLALKLANLVQQRQCEVILSTQLWTSIIAILARKYLPPSIRIIVSVDNHPTTFLLHDKNGDFYAHLIREHLNLADRVVAVSKGVAQDLTEHFGVKPEKLEVIYTPVLLKKIQKSAQEEVEHPWFCEKVPIVLFVGGLKEIKGLGHLLRAFAEIRRATPARCVLVGDGEEQGKLEELARELGIEKDVYFAGRQSNPFKYMKRATVFVLPSLSEGLPNVLIEALACGCPVIASDVASGGSQEVLGNGEYGVLVPPGDEKALAQAILHLLQDISLRKKLSRAGSTRVRQFDASKSIAQYIRLIRHLREQSTKNAEAPIKLLEVPVEEKVVDRFKINDTKSKLMVVVPLMEVGGAERGTAILLEHIDRHRVEPELTIVFNRRIFYTLPQDVPVHILEQLPDPQESTDEVDLPSEFSQYQRGRVFLEKTALKLATLAEQQKINVILATQLWSSLVAVLARKYLPSQTRVIVSVDSHPSTRLPGREYAELFMYLIRKHFNEADWVVAVSHGVAQDLVENFGVQADRIKVIHYPINLAQVQELSQEPVEHLWFTGHVPVVLFVGRLDPVKGLGHLLRALARVRQIMQVRCVLVGDGGQRPQLEALAQELGIAEDVWFAGKQSNPFRYMKRATVFVLPSLSEGLPNVLIEAMACGCPVIASDVASGGSREVLGGGEYGVLVPAGDENAMADALLKLLCEDSLQQAFRQKGPQRAQDFDTKSIIPQYDRLLKKLKLMIVTNSMSMGGAERCTSLLLKHLDRRLVGLDLVMIFDRETFYSVPPDVNTHILARQFQPEQRVDRETLPPALQKYHDGFVFMETTALKLAKLVRERQPDVILATQFWSSLITLLAKHHISSETKVVASVDIHLSHMLPEDKHGELFRYLASQHLAKADRIITLCEGMKSDLNNYGVPVQKISIIYNPIDLEDVKNLAQEEPEERSWFSDNQPVVLFVGRLEPVKGVEYLLSAFKRVSQAVHARCILVGDGSQRKQLEKLASVLGISEDVYFAGRKSNPFKYMERATVLVQPSLMEVLPYTLIEALTCGCPVIASDVPSGGVRELLQEGRYGLLVPPADEEALAKAILRVLRDHTLRERLAQQGPQRSKEFDVRKLAMQYIHLLSQL
jgi:glycosyltransferase involved in cell wall biosynthesis